jgi:hypothetical protein
MKPGQDFSNAQAGGSIVGGSLTQITNYTGATALSGSIKDLVLKLQKEIDEDHKAAGWIEDLLFFEENAPDDDIEGLEAKLKAGGMSQKSGIALKQKEMFAKFLEKRALYGAAQQLLALCLHRIFADFEAHVHPNCGKLQPDELHLKIHDKIICPVVEEFCQGAFNINHSLVFGMIYWLADRCYVRWHEAA